MTWFYVLSSHVWSSKVFQCVAFLKKTTLFLLYRQNIWFLYKKLVSISSLTFLNIYLHCEYDHYHSNYEGVPPHTMAQANPAHTGQGHVITGLTNIIGHIHVEFTFNLHIQPLKCERKSKHQLEHSKNTQQLLKTDSLLHICLLSSQTLPVPTTLGAYKHITWCRYKHISCLFVVFSGDFVFMH